jgi:hypothetical protein
MKTSLKAFITSMFSEIIPHVSLAHLKRAIIILVFLSEVIYTQGQTLNLQVGPSFSKLFFKLSWGDRCFLDSNVTGFNSTMGIDYWDHKYFNLSSNVGFVQKGGKDCYSYYSPAGELDSIKPFRVRLNYLTLNTSFVLKIPIKDAFSPFIFAGPRIDYLISYEDRASVIEHIINSIDFDNLYFGLLTGAGVSYKIDKFTLGLVFNYYVNLYNIWEYTQDFHELEIGNNKISLSDRTFTLNFRIGYKL